MRSTQRSFARRRNRPLRPVSLLALALGLAACADDEGPDTDQRGSSSASQETEGDSLESASDASTTDGSAADTAGEDDVEFRQENPQRGGRVPLASEEGKLSRSRAGSVWPTSRFGRTRRPSARACATSTVAAQGTRIASPRAPSANRPVGVPEHLNRMSREHQARL